MNRYFKIVPFLELPKVKYYSILFEGEEEDIAFKFFKQFKNEVGFNSIKNAIELMGKDHYAQERFFRFENNAHALPPQKNSIIYLDESTNLRLYCLRWSDELVFIFNGGVKTTNQAQDCPNVKKYFEQANKISKIIDTAYQDGTITIEEKKIIEHSELQL